MDPDAPIAVDEAGNAYEADEYELACLERGRTPFTRKPVSANAEMASAPPPERPPPAESRKKTRGTGALQAALAAAAPAAAAPQPPTATSPLAPALLADANPFRLLA